MSVGYRWGFFILLLVTTLAKVKSYSLPYEASDNCKNSMTEYLYEAHCCSKCRPGTRMATACTSNTDTVCEPCPDGMYSDNMNYYPNCFLCAKCPEEKGMKYAKQCSKESNAVCVCKPGWYCVSLEEPDNSCSTCEKYRMCGPGKGAKSPGLPVAGLLVVLLTLTLCIRHRKADSSSDPSTASSSDSHSQGTGVSQDCLHAEHSTVSSPIVNLSFTATINCQVNPTTGSCSIPISPCVHSLEPEFPLSQEEELSVSCEQEDSKDAIQSVQESGMTKY
ncbi:tumor necrosis factor receptor superfamily, member 1B precursor [Silurus asotus]|uniref:Tumor necrosis factor receptor superfamily, member 1B n=1 Tax=Silurus asotus TaxID=30991 RepID=A0AAD5AVT4_SILAS|nr:tumor necrosis factor receptor superfamily, member 1B precursor [Silurus asotus]